MKQRGFANIVLIILVFILAGATGYFALQKRSPEIQQENSSIPASNSNVSQTAIIPTPTTSDEITNGGTYHNKRLGIELIYPSNFIVNEAPNKYWKDANQGNNDIDYSYRFFELVDSKRGCYIGPVREVGLDLNFDIKSIRTASGNFLTVKYFRLNDGTMYLIHSGIDILGENYNMPLNLASLSNSLIESSYKNTSFGKSISDSCIKDFEAILSSLRLAK